MKKIFYYAISIILLTSCNNNFILDQDTQNPIITQQVDELYFIPDTCSFTFTYEGVTYIYCGIKNSNEKGNTLRSSTQRDNSLYEELMRKDGLCTIVKEDGNLELYNSLEEFFNMNYSTDNSNILTKRNNLLRSGINPELEGRMFLYDRDYFIHYGDNVPIGSNFFDTKIKYESDITWYNKDMSFQGNKFQNLKMMSFILNYSLTGVWPDNSTLNVALFENYNFMGQCLIYERSLANSQNPEGSIAEVQLSRIGWSNRVKSIRTHVLILTPRPRLEPL
ncbi:MAG: hypothetical protein LBV03_06385 [Fusobacteriales bacterium]|jgi:hypothetical protein|nr:hypothetical protein [Fusobacteriales bacterium]